MSTSLAHGRLVVSDPDQPSLQEAVYFFEDVSTALTLEDIQQSSLDWQRGSGGVFNRGFSESHWWLRMDLENQSAAALRRYVEISYSQLDYVNVYIVDAGGIISQYPMGDKLPFNARPVDSPNFVFPINWQPQQNLTLYIEVHSTGSIQVPLEMWQQEDYIVHQMHLENIQGVYWGGMLVIFLYNVLLFFALRDNIYLWYVGSVFFMALMFSVLNGQAFRFLWPEVPQINNIALLITISLDSVFSVQFANKFLNFRKVAPRTSKAMNGFVFMFLGIVMTSWLVPYHLAIQLTVVCIIPVATLAFGMAIFRAVIGDRSARLFILAWSVVLLGILTITLNKFDIVPANFITNNAAQFGSMLEAVLLSFALADRINQEKKLRFAAQKELLQASDKMKQELEDRVTERTQDLETLNQKLELLSQTDQLTGINNRRCLEQKIKEEFDRCSRYNHPISILMIDVDHFKSVNDQYGHVAGDLCLKSIATHLIGGVRRPPDMAARYGGEEFCLLLPETDTKGAVVAAERIRESIRGSVVSCDKRTFSVSISVGVFTQKGGVYNGEQALKNADAALYKAKDEGRDRVMVSELC